MPPRSYDKINPSYPRARSLQRWCEDHKVPAGAVPLLKEMLTVNPKQRITAADAYTVSRRRGNLGLIGVTDSVLGRMLGPDGPPSPLQAMPGVGAALDC